MVYTQPYCAKCGSEQIRRNGSKNGQPNYQGTACRYPGLVVPASVRQAAPYAQVDAWLVERHSQRSSARATGGARMTIAKRLKKSGRSLAAPAAAAPKESSAQTLAGAGTS